MDLKRRLKGCSDGDLSALLRTATGAALRGFQVIVPVDGMSAGDPYAEQYTCWHIVLPVSERQVDKSGKMNIIEFR